MNKGLTILLSIAAILASGSTGAEQVDVVFHADSLVPAGGDYLYQYRGLKSLSINKDLTLPIKTIFLETASDISDISIISDPKNQISIGIVPEQLAYTDNSITGIEKKGPHSPPDKWTELRNCRYSVQIINNDGRNLLAVSVLPVTIDSSNRIIFNKKIVLSAEGVLGAPMDATGLRSSMAEDAGINRSFQSPKTGANGSISNGVELVILTSASLADAFQELADFKNAIGIPTSIVLFETVCEAYPGRDDAEKIRNYLIKFYSGGGKYVILGGNDAVIPARYLYYYNTSSPPSDPYNLMPSDLYYADLDGDWDLDGDGVWGEPTHDAPDIVPELLVGRLPVMTIEAVENYTEKLILYQTDPGNGDFGYLEKSLFFSSDQMRDYPEGGQHGFISVELPEFISVDTGQTIEMPDGFDPNPVNPGGEFGISRISEGYGLIHILAHGRTDGFRVKAANYGGTPSSLILTAPQSGGHGSLVDLEPNGKVSLYYSLSCEVGGYDLDSVGGVISDWSFVERIISAEKAGAIGMVGYARWGWVYSSYFLEASFTEHLFGDADGSPVRAMHYSWLDYPYYRDLIYGQNFFGDPSIKIYQTIPSRLSLDLSSLPEDNLIKTTIQGLPVSGAVVTLALDDKILETGFTDEQGIYIISSELVYGIEYRLTALMDGCTIAHKLYSPAMILDAGEEIVNNIPENFRLEQNFPNPFNPSTTIEYSLPQRCNVTLEIFNILGQLILSEELKNREAGVHRYIWNSADWSSQAVSSGIYFYRLQADDFVETRKMVLLK